MQPVSTQTSVNGRNRDDGAEGAALPEDTAKHFMTRGEHKFNHLTSNYIGYIANALLSVVAVFWAERTQSGQKFIQRFGERAAKIPNVNPETAKFFATKSFFLAGGFAVLVPMKWLENKKAALVKRWNQETYGAGANTDTVRNRKKRWRKHPGRLGYPSSAAVCWRWCRSMPPWGCYGTAKVSCQN